MLILTVTLHLNLLCCVLDLHERTLHLSKKYPTSEFPLALWELGSFSSSHAINQILNGTVFWVKTHRETLFRCSVHLYWLMFLILIIKHISLSLKKRNAPVFYSQTIFSCNMQSQLVYISGYNNGFKTLNISKHRQNRSLSSLLKAWCFYGYWLLKAVQGLFCCSSPLCSAH